MTFLPSEYINSSYNYYINNDYIVVRTNNNCYTQYNTIYCDTYNVYPKLDYLISEPYSSSLTTNTRVLSYTNFSDNFYYRLDFANILIISFIIGLFVIYLPYRIISRMFGRWLKI